MQSDASYGLRLLHRFLEQLRRAAGLAEDTVPAVEELASWLNTLQAAYNVAPMPMDWGTFSIDASGDTNAATLKAAVESGENLRLPVGTFPVASAALIPDTFGQSIVGAGRQRTILQASDAGDMFDISNYRIRLADLTLDGNNVGTRGVLLSDGARFELERAEVSNFTGWGLTSDVAASGNNNLVTMRHVLFQSNDVGFGMDDYSSADDTNQTTWEMYMVDSQDNSSHGALLKGTSHSVFKGNFAGNGGYGLQFGESTDSSTTTGITVFYPYIESNTSGGIGDGKSARCTVYLESIMQGVDRSSTTDIVEVITQAATVSGEVVIETGDGLTLSLTGSGLTAGGSTNVDLSLTPAGTGKVTVESGGLGIPNSASASGLGAIANVFEIFTEAGASLGYVPIYGSFST